MNSTASFWLQQILFFYLMSSRSIPATSSKCLPMPNVHFFAEWARKTDDQKSLFPLKGSSHQGIRYLICISDLACWYETGIANLSTNSCSRYRPTIISTEASALVTQPETVIYLPTIMHTFRGRKLCWDRILRFYSLLEILIANTEILILRFLRGCASNSLQEIKSLNCVSVIP